MNRYAILIANGKFPNFPELDTLELPGNDLRRLEDELGKLKDWPFLVTPLLDQEAGDITQAITDAVLKSGPDDLLLIHYSGHGLTNKTASALYLTASDTQTNRNPLREVAFQVIA